MRFLLSGSVLGKSFRAALSPGTHTVGSAPESDVRLADPTVSRRHAALDVGDEAVTVRDLGSSNGTYLAGRRISEGTLAPGAGVAFGSVELRLETVEDDDLEPALGLATTRPSAPEPAPPATTLGVAPVDAALLRHLPALLEAAGAGEGETTVAARAGPVLLELLPLARLEVVRRGGGVLFTGGDGAERESRPRVSRVFGDLEADAVPEGIGAEGAIADALDLLLRLVAIAGRRPDRGRRAAEPPRPVPPAAPPVPEPPSLHPELRAIYRDAARVARGDVSVLILGESGTGKEVLARYLHAASGAPEERFVALNCAALPRDLLEAELFGVESGAATGVAARPGRFELAHGGTLFLDEIGDMAPATQAQVLRVVQEGTCHRLGGTEPRPARPRIVSATNQDLRALMADGRFRADLYHRIAAWEVALPPLRERRVDVPNLAIHFLAEEARNHGRRLGGISRRALRALEAFDWPGNVRQLRQEIARAALFLDDDELLDTRNLSPAIAALAEAPEPRGLDERLARHERAEIEAALEAAEGDVARAARALDLHRSTLYRRMKKLGIGQG